MHRRAGAELIGIDPTAIAKVMKDVHEMVLANFAARGISFPGGRRVRK